MFENSLRISTISRVLVLCTIIMVQNYLPTELSSPIIVLIGLSIMIFGKMQTSYFKLVWPLLGVLAIGFLGVFNHELRDILRDISFALAPIALIVMGYWLADSPAMRPLILKIMATFAFVFAVVHLSTFALHPELLGADLGEVRRTAGGTSDLVVLALVLGLLQKHLGINNLFPRLLPRFIAIPVLLASFVLSYSRTELMVAVMLTLSLLGWISGINRRLVFAVTLIMVGFFTLAAVTPEDEEGTFRSKLVKSVSEITIADYQDYSDISNNWRGFEAQKAVDSFSSGNTFEWVFGQGFGALVDLGFYIPLGAGDEGDVEFRYLPVLHNGYAYILLKTGLLGLASYLFFYISVIRYGMRNSNSMNNAQTFFGRLLLGTVLSLVLTMMVVGGMAEVHNAEFVLLLGYLVRRIEQLRTQRIRIGLERVS